MCVRVSAGVYWCACECAWVIEREIHRAREREGDKMRYEKVKQGDDALLSFHLGSCDGFFGTRKISA